MELTHRFTVPAPIDEAWKTFNDLEKIAPCFPGASLTSFDGDNFEGICKVKLGPISLQYAGSGRFVERDEAAHRAVIEAKGKDKRGNGTAAAGVTAELTAAGPDSTEVTVNTDLNITGRPAQFGRGVMQDVSDKLLGQFATCLEDKMGATPDASEPASTESSAAPASDATPASGQPASSTEPAAKHRASFEPSSGVSSAGSSSGGRSAAPGSAQQAAELDLGVTVLPVLLKRYAPHLVGALLVLLVLKKLLGRRS